MSALTIPNPHKVTREKIKRKETDKNKLQQATKAKQRQRATSLEEDKSRTP
jgi:hypothetical protein